MLPTDKQERKACPIARGVLDYFPLAIAEVARLSHAANEQHNPGEPMHWAREKSNDHADCLVRHLIDRGTVDEDGQLHSAKVAWRALAMLQLELEERQSANSQKPPAMRYRPHPLGFSRSASCGCGWNGLVHGDTCPEHGNPAILETVDAA
jgi:hypothetical protein